MRLPVAIVIAVLAGAWLFWPSSSAESDKPMVIRKISTLDSNDVFTLSLEEAVEQQRRRIVRTTDWALAESVQPDADLIQFTPNEFRDIFGRLTLPNTAGNDSILPITGHEEADAHIRSVAESRGYVRRGEVDNTALLTGAEIQSGSMATDWADLVAAARQAEGIEFSIQSAFRSTADQTGIFLFRLNSEGLTLDDVAAGLHDDILHEILGVYSIPGYSKHHTGYAIDIADRGVGFEGFSSTAGFAWLSANNYENAKRYGFIPSYPEGATDQGPNPEAWEYVWVGRNVLLVDAED